MKEPSGRQPGMPDTDMPDSDMPDSEKPDAGSDGQEELARVTYDINNALGGLISSLYLCVSDIEPDHPLRGRLEAANATSLRLRSLVKRLEAVVSRH